MKPNESFDNYDSVFDAEGCNAKEEFKLLAFMVVVVLALIAWFEIICLILNTLWMLKS